MKFKKLTESFNDGYKAGDRVELPNGQTGIVAADYVLGDDRVAVDIEGMDERKYPLVDTLRLIADEAIAKPYDSSKDYTDGDVENIRREFEEAGFKASSYNGYDIYTLADDSGYVGKCVFDWKFANPETNAFNCELKYTVKKREHFAAASVAIDFLRSGVYDKGLHESFEMASMGSGIDDDGEIAAMRAEQAELEQKRSARKERFALMHKLFDDKMNADPDARWIDKVYHIFDTAESVTFVGDKYGCIPGRTEDKQPVRYRYSIEEYDFYSDPYWEIIYVATNNVDPLKEDLEDEFELLQCAADYRCKLTRYDMEEASDYDQLLEHIKQVYLILKEEFGENLRVWRFYEDEDIDFGYKVWFKDRKPAEIVEINNGRVDKIDLNETYWIDSKDVMNEVSRLGKELEADGWKYYGDKYSGSTYYDFYMKRGDKGAICKAIQFNYDGAQVIDITVDQMMGYKPIDGFETMRRRLGKILLPQHEDLEANAQDFPYMFFYNCNNPTFGYDFQLFASSLGAKKAYGRYNGTAPGSYFYLVPSEEVYNKLKEVAKSKYTVDMQRLLPYDAEKYPNVQLMKEEMTSTQYVICGVTNEGTRMLYDAVNDNFTTDYDSATKYDDMDVARDDWFKIPRSGFRRIFIPVYDPAVFESLNEGSGADTAHVASDALKIAAQGDKNEWAKTAAQIIDVIPDDFADQLFDTVKAKASDIKLSAENKKKLVDASNGELTENDVEDCDTLGKILALVDGFEWAEKNPGLLKGFVMVVLSIVAIIEPTPVVEIITLIVGFLPAEWVAKIVAILNLTTPTGMIGTAANKIYNTVKNSKDEVTEDVVEEPVYFDPDDEFEVDFRYYVYANEDDVVSDPFEFEEDAIEWAKENNYPIVKIHNYYRDTDGDLNPDGDPEVVWKA